MKHRKHKSNIMFILIAVALLIIGCIVVSRLMAYPYSYNTGPVAPGVTVGVGSPYPYAYNQPGPSFGLTVGSPGYYPGYWGGRGWGWGGRRWGGWGHRHWRR